MKTTQNLVGGAWQPAQDGRTLDLADPGRGVPFAAMARSAAADIDAAVAAARHAFESHWEKTPAVERGRHLARMAALMAASADELARLESQDTGKPLKQSRVDATVAARYFEFYAGAADKITGDTIPFLPGHQALTIREPHGVTGHIIPWNYPLQMGARTIAAALCAGNAIVLKPAEEAGLTVIRMGELALEAGIPPDVVNIVTGLGEEAGAALAGHPGLDHVCFTGSPAVGALVQKASADHNRSVTMELGGKSPQIVFADADWDKALPVVTGAIVQNAGQTCSAGSRLLVERSIYDDFVAATAERFAALKVGAWDQDLDCGPLISETQRSRVAGFMDAAAADGIPIIAQASIDADAPEGGYFVQPTLYGPVPQANALARDEVFGPVLSAIPFDDEAEAVRIANDTEYGLTAGVWTENGGRQMRMGKALKCGQVFVNCYGAGGGVELPFGGYKRSGFGREKGMEALHDLTVCKTVILKHD